jgi:hypothetical protein
MATELNRVVGLDRRQVRNRAVSRFGVDRMVAEYETVYKRLVEAHRHSIANEGPRR